MTSQCLPLHGDNSSKEQNYSYHFDSKHKWQSPLLIFLIAGIDPSVQNTNLHLEIGGLD